LAISFITGCYHKPLHNLLSVPAFLASFLPGTGEAGHWEQIVII